MGSLGHVGAEGAGAEDGIADRRRGARVGGAGGGHGDGAGARGGGAFEMGGAEGGAALDRGQLEQGGQVEDAGAELDAEGGEDLAVTRGEALELLLGGPGERGAEALLELIDDAAAGRAERARGGGAERGEQLLDEVAGERDQAAEDAGAGAGADLYSLKERSN